MKVDKFSLDYVVSGSQPNKESPFPLRELALNEATIVFSQPILTQLSQAENRQMRLHDLIEKVNQVSPVSSFEQFQGVINQLASLGFVEIAERDIRGNHLIRLLKDS
jgi:hypothetical protein